MEPGSQNSVWRRMIDGLRTASPRQSPLFAAGLLLAVSGLVHLAIWIAQGTPSLAGPVSWRKPILFGVSAGLTALSLGWIAGLLPAARRAWDVWLSRVLAAGLTAEVGLITLQAWRGVPSHFNHATPLDAGIDTAMTALITVATLGIAVFTVRSFGRLGTTADAVVAIRIGLLMLLLSCGMGFVIAGLGEANLAAGRPPEVYGEAGALKFPHGVPMHAVQWLTLVSFLSARAGWGEPARVRLVAIGAVGQIAATSYALWQTFHGRGRLDWDLPAAVLFYTAVTAIALPFAAAIGKQIVPRPVVPGMTTLPLFLSLLMAAGAEASPAAPPAAAAAPAPARRPNVLIILADDLGYSDLGCYGGEIATPNLDGLAAGGLRFTQFYNTARCWPSRAAILTGQYAQAVRRDAVPGVPSGGQGVRPPWARLLPEILRPLGYRSYHSGKWHVDGKPTENGFDRSYQLNDAGRYFSPKTHLEDGKPLPPVKPGSGYYTTTAIAEHAITYLKEHAAGHADKPFLAYVAFTAPHFPLHAPAEDIARYKDRYRAGWEALRKERYARQRDMGLVDCKLSDVEPDVGPPYHFPKALEALGPGEVNRPKPWAELTDQQREFQAAKMAVHAAMVDRMDREIGRILAQVRAMGAADDTLILFLSDNGASAEIMVRDDGHDPAAAPGSAAGHLCLGPGWSNAANTPMRRHKTWVHEGGISTPLVACWPKGIAARGELRRTPGHLIDVVPTVLEIAGGRMPETLGGKPVPPPPGRSLVPAFARDVTVERPELWWSHEGNRAVRVGDWKLVAVKGGPWELYNLAADRSETEDLSANYPDKVRELEAAWNRRNDECTALAKREPPPPGPKPKAGKKD